VPIEALIPLGLKVVYTLFVCALVPIYWREYGPANFLWFSDIALLALCCFRSLFICQRIFFSPEFFEAQDRKGDRATAKTTFDIKCCQQDPRMIF